MITGRVMEFGGNSLPLAKWVHNGYMSNFIDAVCEKKSLLLDLRILILETYLLLKQQSDIKIYKIYITSSTKVKSHSEIIMCVMNKIGKNGVELGHTIFFICGPLHRQVLYWKIDQDVMTLIQVANFTGSINVVKCTCQFPHRRFQSYTKNRIDKWYQYNLLPWKPLPWASGLPVVIQWQSSVPGT